MFFVGESTMISSNRRCAFESHLIVTKALLAGFHQNYLICMELLSNENKMLNNTCWHEGGIHSVPFIYLKLNRFQRKLQFLYQINLIELLLIILFR